MGVPEEKEGRLRIFLSYGRDEHAPLARQVKADLVARGHDVWFDEEQLEPGSKWEYRIERGLDLVAGAGERGRFVLLMTPHSVRRPDGYCLNEVAWALARSLAVVPVMVVWCEPPLSIYRVQWLDMQDCIPAQQRTERYQVKISQLVEALESGKDFAPSDEEIGLRRLLDPVEFEADIAPHLARFTGREWVFRDIDAWLDDENGPPVYWITGNPGVGKTALAAWLCHYRPVAAFYLCCHGHRHKSDPRRCVLSIAYQLSTQLPEYRDRLKRLDLKQIVPESNARTLFDTLIAERLSGSFPAPDRRVVVLIDALDEATQGDSNELASFLAAECHKLPRWLRLIVTSRPQHQVTVPLQAFEPKRLEESAAHNEGDLRDYLCRELKPYAPGGVVPKEVVDTILQRSEGGFLYAEWVRRELELERLDLEHAEAFPQGLGGVYLQFFEREFPKSDKYEQETCSALEVVAAAEEPLPLEAVAAVLGWSRRQARNFGRSLGALFTETDRGIEPFHSSVVDWLVDDAKAGPYWVDVDQGHARLAEHGWKQYRQGPAAMSDYARAHLAVHLAGAERWDDLEELLTDAEVIETCCQNKTLAALMGDLRTLRDDPGRLARVSKAMLDAFCRYDRDSFWQQVRGGLCQVFGSYDRWPQAWRECVEAHRCYLVMRFLGDTLDMEERFEEAEQVFRRMLESADPECPEEVATAHIRLAYVLEHLDRPEGGLRVVKQLLAEPGAEERYGRNYRWAQHHQAICLRRMYRYREAREVLERIHRAGIHGEGLTTGPLHQLGIIDLELGRIDEAERKFAECRQLRGEDPWNRRRAYEYRRLGQVYALTNRFQEARGAFDKALEISTNCGDRRYLRETQEDIVAFLDLPQLLLEQAPETASLKQMSKRFPLTDKLLPWAFHVLDRQKKGYLEDLVPDSGEPSDRIARFDVAHQQGLWHASVSVAIIDQDGNVALQKRGEDESYGKWDISVAGHVGVGEDDVAAAIRETAEELGTIVAPDELHPVEGARRFRKEGSPDEKRGPHLDPFHYVYSTDKVNRERVTAFCVRATAEQMAEINHDPPGGDTPPGGYPPRSALEVEWRSWEEVLAGTTAHPDDYASGLKQLLLPEILEKIRSCP